MPAAGALNKNTAWVPSMLWMWLDSVGAVFSKTPVKKSQGPFASSSYHGGFGKSCHESIRGSAKGVSGPSKDAFGTVTVPAGRETIDTNINAATAREYIFI